MVYMCVLVKWILETWWKLLIHHQRKPFITDIILATIIIASFRHLLRLFRWTHMEWVVWLSGLKANTMYMVSKFEQIKIIGGKSLELRFKTLGSCFKCASNQPSSEENEVIYFCSLPCKIKMFVQSWQGRVFWLFYSFFPLEKYTNGNKVPFCNFFITFI